MKSKYFSVMALLFAMSFTIAQVSCAQTPNPQSKASNPNDTTVTVKVSGITCSGDLKMIADNVEKMNGVSSCKQVGKMSTSTSFEVKFDGTKISYSELVKAIEGTASCDHPDQRPYKVKAKN
ncbi:MULTISPECIES: heavy-metal-associated domain-containing protein [Hydrotalea]|uniref:heavy-metal-associated domain-containing protein n=2 Tax=Pseudomonadati TaxID=3379134 RepID=UPI0008344554|nr:MULTISPECIES: heavy-metal-associated domain-containing protein [Hydrotalea]RTL53338.1 MAG: cation transporter [Sphingobacteriales bacterium]RWZ86220.1 MAG: cation transporter [Hydrotalea sp. AMD]